jgi:hypothetical protein
MLFLTIALVHFTLVQFWSSSTSNYVYSSECKICLELGVLFKLKIGRSSALQKQTTKGSALALRQC